LGTTSRRQALRGARTPANLTRGYRGGAMIAASLAMNSIPAMRSPGLCGVAALFLRLSAPA
jgi:precorrin isomerase